MLQYYSMVFGMFLHPETGIPFKIFLKIDRGGQVIGVEKRKKWTTYFKNRLYIAAFILSLVGWFILFVYLFGQFFEKELLALEGTLKSPLFTWGLRIFIIALVIILIKGKKKIRTFFAHRRIKWALYIIVFVGALGWLAWFLSLL